MLRVDEKNRAEYAIPNVCGVIITTNHKTDGIYLPADDRRHFVAWSDLDKSDFTPDYWNELWQLVRQRRLRRRRALPANLDLSGFNPKAPPPKTSAFCEIVNASRAPEDAELADVLDACSAGQKRRAQSRHIIAATTQADFVDYLKDRKNSRRIPHRFEACGYTPVRNPDAEDGLWRLNGRRQVDLCPQQPRS